MIGDIWKPDFNPLHLQFYHFDKYRLTSPNKHICHGGENFIIHAITNIEEQNDSIYPEVFNIVPCHT